MTALRSTNQEEPKPKIDFSVTQVAAAALAAVTSAVFSSQLGAAGTLIGAAGASAIFTAASTVYRFSLERGEDRVRSLARRARPVPASGEHAETEPPGDERPENEPPGDERPGDRAHWSGRWRWWTVAVGGVGAFLLAMLVITGFEFASGETLGGNGKGTTIGRVVNAPGGLPKPAPPSAPPSSSVPPSSSAPPSEAPTETSSRAPTTPGGDAGGTQSPSATSGVPAPSEVQPTTPVLPTEVPGIGD